MSSSQMISADAARTHSLTSLITASHSNASTTSPGPSRKVYPTEDSITALLASRFRSEHPYIRVGDNGTDYVVVNPLRMLGCMNEESRKAYQRRMESTARKGKEHDLGDVQPSVYDLAGRVWMLMSRKKESQSVIYHGLTGSGKSTTSRHLTSQILHLSSHSKAQKRVSDQINCLQTLLESFGHSKTPLNPSASQYGRYLELHFDHDGSITGAKVLPFGLNKTRLGRLQHEERTFHVFYQLLAGASPEERDSLDLQDPTSYGLLSSSGCYRLPGGPFSDDSVQLGELRVAFASLGFKAKHVRSIFTLLATILLLSNLTFSDDRDAGSLGMTSMDEQARVDDRLLLAEVAAHLGVSPDELEAVLINKTKWVRHDLCSILLDSEGASNQRDSLMKDLYAILFTFVVEMANKKLASGEGSAPELQIVQLDLPGYQSRTPISRPQSSASFSSGPLINAAGQNGFEEFSINFANEMVHSYVLQRAFDDDLTPNSSLVDDGIHLSSVVTMDNSGCIELLRGGPLSSTRLVSQPSGVIGAISSLSQDLKGEEPDEHRTEEFLGAVSSSFARHSSFVADTVAHKPRRHIFGINHYSGQCSYDVTDFVEANNDVLDKQLVDLLRSSADPFVAKLVSGPGLATEGHPLDQNITVEAQVSVSPLRTATPIINSIFGAKEARESDWALDNTVPQPIIGQVNSTLSTLLSHMDSTRAWNVLCIRPNDSGHANSFDKRRVKSQIWSLLLTDLVKRRQADYIADYTFADFAIRHGLPGSQARDAIEEFANSRGWLRGIDFDIGKEKIWLGWNAWKEQDDLIRRNEVNSPMSSNEELSGESVEGNRDLEPPHRRSMGYGGGTSSTENLLTRRGSQPNTLYPDTPEGDDRASYLGYRDSPDELPKNTSWSNLEKEYEPSPLGYSDRPPTTADPLQKKELGSLGDEGDGEMIVHEKKHHATEVIATTSARRWWLRITWALTWWIPSFLLSSLGGMKRADVRMAWREKVAIFMMIIFMCGVVLFYIVVFGMLLCPDSAKAWNPTELSEHQGTNDYYAAIAGKVYDFTKFYKGQHSDIQAYTTSSDIMLEFAGQDLTDYFPPPMNLACPNLVTSDQLSLMRANFTPIVAYAVHTSGALQTTSGTKLDQDDWYTNTLLPNIQQYYKGSFVYDKAYVADQADSASRQWAIYNNKVYDLSDYLYTIKYYSSSSGTDLPNYSFLNSDLSTLFQTQAGQDITSNVDQIFEGMSSDDVQNTMNCLNTAFYVGELDYRLIARCTVQNYLLLAFSIILITTIASKFLAALQLGSKRHPELLDKFVICQVPCYTEGEESLQRTINSLAVLNYDDKRKLIFIICDGNIIGSGNNRPTPRIVLDILGVDPKLDPEPLLFKSIGEGSKQLNYAKVYSGLYEHEGHVVPYVVIVKVGKPTETSKPGNRGKRDSQVMLLQYLNRVHFDAAMCPLELEIYHQMRNVIGIDPTFYEYIFQVDADTTVTPDSLNRLISCAADDSRIIGICGETKVENERESLTTMIQVYEYYISHHLTKAFESLFGSVTCLPGCFSVYRIRTADKGRPVIISSMVIDEYAEPNVDTLHKKNLFSLGEDRYLTTLMMKHFPTFKMKFTPDAVAHTIAPSRWNVLLSQRRRWINSTIHNLVELMSLPEMCGFCFFSMRFIVFIDLLGTIILPATCGYLIYLIVVVSTGKAAIPVVSLIMIGAVYGLQAIIFILKREFMLVGWMVLYILAFPVYSVFLPLYSFWSMDDFSWGNTRKVVGEGNNKTVVYEDDEPFQESMIPYKSFKEYESNAWETTSLHSEKSRDTSHTSNTRTTRSGRTARSRPFSNANSRAPSEMHLAPGGDYWRDASPLGAAHSSRNLREMGSNPALRHSSSNPYFPPTQGGLPGSRIPSMAEMSMWGGGPPGPGSEYGGPMPQLGQSPYLPPMTLGNPFDSPATSDYGGGSMRPPTYLSPFGQPQPQGFGGNTVVPRNSVMSGLNSYGGGLQNRMSSYSLATTANPLGGTGLGRPPTPDQDPNPNDEKVVETLRKYLQSQDLMNVTKRQTREALFGLFPNANLQTRAAWVNENIDKILSG